jgi:hypothetical protein
MLTSVDRSFRCRDLIALDNKSTKAILFEGIDSIFRLDKKAGFKIKRIHCDQEFQSVIDEVSDEMDIRWFFLTATEHVPEAE